jgi:hypothetical protein
MYNLMQYVDISDGNPGMLIPLFSSSSTNLPYVQEMDEYFQVKAMLPFLDYENYNLVTAERALTVGVNDRGLVAFRSADQSIFCGNVADVIRYFEASRELIRKSPHLYSQLGRIEGDQFTSMYENWGLVARESFESKVQQAFWLDSEVSLFQSQRQIWDEINSDKREENSGKRIGLKEGASRYSSEYLIRWLSDRNNFIYSDWVKVWLYVNEGNPFEQRLLDVAQRWLFFNQAEGGDLGEARSVLFTLLHHARFSRGTFKDLGSFLSDELSESPYAIFYFLRPSELFANLLWFLGSYGDSDGVLEIAEFCANELPREKYIIDSLTEGLNILVDRPNEDEAGRRRALKLIEELRTERIAMLGAVPPLR